ncbi:hypothetical protein MMPV_002186 [Pyropia vietnamensis]
MKPSRRSGYVCYGWAFSLAAAAVWAAAAHSPAINAADISAETVTTSATASPLPHVCIVGGGIGGASAAHFLRTAAPAGVKLSLFERRPQLGGRLASMWLPAIHGDSGSGSNGEGDQHRDDVSGTAVAGDSTNSTAAIHVEVGGSIIHPRNRLMVHFVDQVLHLPRRDAPDQSMGLWDGHRFVLRLDKGRPVVNVGRLLWRYGLSLPRMQAAVGRLLASFDAIYGAGPGVPVVDGGGGGDGDGVSHNGRGGHQGGGSWKVGVARLHKATRGLLDIFRARPASVVSPPPDTVAGLLSPRGDGSLVDLATRRLGAYASSAGLRPPLTAELVAAITRVNYGQEATGMAALAGAVGLAGSGGGLWAVAGGNAQVPAGLIARAGVTVYASEAVTRVASVWSADGGTGGVSYVLTSVSASASDDAVGSALSASASVARGGASAPAGGADRGSDGPSLRVSPPLAPNASRTTVCDAVVLATPLELSGGLVVGEADTASAGSSAPPPPPPPPPARPFRTCVATFVRAEVEPTYWGLPRDCCGCVPDVVLTTAAAPTGGVPFTSLSALSRPAQPASPRACADGPDRAVYKLFSPAPLTTADLGRLFRAHTVLAVVPWAAYPEYNPPLVLRSFLLDGGYRDASGAGDRGSDNGGIGASRGGGGEADVPAVTGRLVYVNAIESAASAMEMSALGGKAAAALVANALGWGAQRREGRSPPVASPPSPESPKAEL